MIESIPAKISEILAQKVGNFNGSIYLFIIKSYDVTFLSIQGKGLMQTFWLIEEKKKKKQNNREENNTKSAADD